MTGYARAEQQGPWGRLSWELRSVNHRYLDLQIKLPDEFRVLESELRILAGAKMGRGKVEAGLRFNREVAVGDAPEPDRNRLRELRAALNVVAEELGPLAQPEPMRVLAWPGVVRQDAAEVAPPLAEATALFQKALADFADTRGREGERTAAFLRERLDAMAVLVERVRVRGPQVRDAWLERLRARVADLGVEVEPQRLAQEVALAAQRADVDEEMARLISHFTEVRDTLARDEAIGRRLDFLMQELNREANTLSSKSQDAEMTRCAVEMKVIIEQMREQVQNIE
ncbi:MAG TPA: YicC/YloC family endoribonuclease [Nevskia sp.]|nr:YicC/YloC family endoribonuclease [Nevskia sp.]